MIFSVEDITNDEVILAGKYHRATLEQPEEYDEVYSTVGESLDLGQAFMVTNGKSWILVTEDDKACPVVNEDGSNEHDANLFDIVSRLARGVLVSDQDMLDVESWLEGEGGDEEGIIEYIAEKGQERLEEQGSY